jgi:hypothetical protein
LVEGERTSIEESDGSPEGERSKFSSLGGLPDDLF